jgi:hypothetical protein
VAKIARRDFNVRVTIDTSGNAISIREAAKRVQSGRGFVLQGNLSAFRRGNVNHAIYVNEVRGGTPAKPAEALVYDPSVGKARWVRWRKVVRFGLALTLDDQGRTLRKDRRLYTSFMPPKVTPKEEAELPAAKPGPDGVKLRFDARSTSRVPRQFEANAPEGQQVAVRRRPDRIDPGDVVDRLWDGEPFIAFQRTDSGERPSPSASPTWFGNRDGTEWVHRSGLRASERMRDGRRSRSHRR